VSVINWLVGIFTAIVTLFPQTVTVEGDVVR
jgi:hypothetical protein